MCAWPASAQIDAAQTGALAPNGLPFPQVSPAAAAQSARAAADSGADGANGGVAGAPKMISLRLTGVTMQEALSEIGRQTGREYHLGYSNMESDAVFKLHDRKIAVVAETPWASEAMRAIAEAAGVSAHLQVGFGDFVESDITGSETAPQSGVGPFQIQLPRLELLDSKSVQLGDGAALPAPDHRLSVILDWTSDPQLQIVGGPRLRLTRADDEAGRSLLVEETARQSPDYYQANPIRIGLKLPAAGAQTLAHLEGVATYVLPTKLARWEVPDLMATPNAEHQFGSNGETVTVKITRVTRDGANLKLEMQAVASRPLIEGQAANPLIATSSIFNSLRLTQADGRKYISRGGTSTGGAKNISDIRADFALGEANLDQIGVPNPNDPIRLSLEVPTEWVQTDVPFAFENVPLP